MVIFHSRLLNYQRVSQNIPTTSTVESILIICSGLEGTQFLVSSMIRWCPPDVNVGEHKPHENYRYITNKNHIVIGVYWSYVHQLSIHELGHHRTHDTVDGCEIVHHLGTQLHRQHDETLHIFR